MSAPTSSRRKVVPKLDSPPKVVKVKPKREPAPVPETSPFYISDTAEIKDVKIETEIIDTYFNDGTEMDQYNRPIRHSDKTAAQGTKREEEEASEGYDGPQEIYHANGKIEVITQERKMIDMSSAENDTEQPDEPTTTRRKKINDVMFMEQDNRFYLCNQYDYDTFDLRGVLVAASKVEEARDLLYDFLLPRGLMTKNKNPYIQLFSGKESLVYPLWTDNRSTEARTLALWHQSKTDKQVFACFDHEQRYPYRPGILVTADDESEATDLISTCLADNGLNTRNFTVQRLDPTVKKVYYFNE